ncbi:MAG TPA: hypothetical protein VN887_07700 [Candidatus Angelobacter sp.]|nr:hypothetical protein [Candidatus Angelobacter sp.]
MDSQQAKDILMRYRPGVADATDADVDAALEQARRDPHLGRWFDQHCAFQTAVRNRLKQLPVPVDLKETILAGYGRVLVIVWWQRPVYRALAAAAAVVLVAALIYFRPEPREDKSFAAFRDRVVRSAQRGYAMDLTTTNLGEIRTYLAEHHGHADYTLPPALKKLPGDGCAVLRWQNKTVSMVCFDLGNHNDLYLFVAKRSDLPDAPSTAEPQFVRIEKLSAASWNGGDNIYVLAGSGDEQFIRNYLPGNSP